MIGRTGLNDTGTGLDVEPRDYEGDIGKVQDLGAVWEREGPQLGGGPEEVYEAVSVAGAYF